jgi:hypothetical protein
MKTEGILIYLYVIRLPLLNRRHDDVTVRFKSFVDSTCVSSCWLRVIMFIFVNLVHEKGTEKIGYKIFRPSVLIFGLYLCVFFYHH